LLASLSLITTRFAALRLVGEASLGVVGLVFGAVLKIASTIFTDEEFILI
jgi:hypothetical protein